MEKEKVSLKDLLGGAAIEAFDYELSRIVGNILDPNTVAIATREIILKVKIKPTEDRELGAISCNCSAKLAPSKPLTSRLYFGMHNGKAVAIEHDPKQPQLPIEEPAKLKAIGGQIK